MAKLSLRDAIQSGRIQVLDGAMGTMLYTRGIFVNACYDELNLSQPDVIGSIHEDYIKAGADIIETNTFGANPVKLSSFGLEDRTEEINRSAVHIAAAAAGEDTHVVGAIGPLGIRIEPWGPTAVGEAEDLFAKQAAGLVAGNVDGFLLETFSDLDELAAAVRAIRRHSDRPIIAQVSVNEQARTSYGTTIEAIADQANALDVDVIGFNCSVGPATMLDAVEQLAELTSKPISAQPNAGLPRTVGDRQMYLASPEYIAQYAKRLIDAGARLVGGCCGTTPEHIKQIRAQVASVQPKLAPAVVAKRSTEGGHSEPAPLAARSALGRKLALGEFITVASVTPPRGWQAETLLAAGRELADWGVDAVQVPDIAQGPGRMAGIAASIILQRDLGLETVMQYTCRDRNMLSMSRDLLGAAGAGLRNVVLSTGAPPPSGPYQDATAVFDIDSIGLTNVVRQLNHGMDLGGSSIGEPTRFVIGVELNLSAPDLEQERQRFAWKVDAGAEFAITPPVFDVDQFVNGLSTLPTPRIPIVATIWPVKSAREVEFLANEVPDVSVPDGIIDRMRRAELVSAAAATKEGIQIATEIFLKIRDVVQGIHVTTGEGDSATTIAFLERAGVSQVQ